MTPWFGLFVNKQNRVQEHFYSSFVVLSEFQQWHSMTQIQQHWFKIAQITSVHKPPHILQSSPNQLYGLKSCPRLSANQRSPLKLFHGTSTRNHSTTSSPALRKFSKSIKSFQLQNQHCLFYKKTFTSQASSDNLKWSLKSDHGIHKQASGRPDNATFVSFSGRQLTNSGFTRAPVSEPERRANETLFRSSKSASLSLQMSCSKFRCLVVSE